MVDGVGRLAVAVCEGLHVEDAHALWLLSLATSHLERGAAGAIRRAADVHLVWVGSGVRELDTCGAWGRDWGRQLRARMAV